jgi:hypothetical protein
VSFSSLFNQLVISTVNDRVHYGQGRFCQSPASGNMARRQAEGLSKMDAVRCLKRFVAREVYKELKRDLLQN